MQTIYSRNVEDLEGHFPFGNGECVALPQAVTHIGPTMRWYPGSRVIDLLFLNPGTVIANFAFNKAGVGHFPNRHGYHAALFVGFGPRGMTSGSAMWITVMDQWRGRRENRVKQRDIRTYSEAESARGHILPSDNAREFYVVLT